MYISIIIVINLIDTYLEFLNAHLKKSDFFFIIVWEYYIRDMIDLMTVGDIVTQKLSTRIPQTLI